ncbi:MAG: hypothetical protein KAJ78_05830 [Acidobacteria bacterium]|nr:hypothetical protein [Acidobacteriota bacterium]
MEHRVKVTFVAVCGVLLCLSGAPVQAQSIGWDDFSGTEYWIDFSGWNIDLPDPVYYEGCTFYEMGSGGEHDGWREFDWTYCFENGSGDFPGLSLGYGMADHREETAIKVEFTDYSGIRRVGILGSAGGVGTYKLEAFDVDLLPLGAVEATVPADCQPVWLGIETATAISYIMLTEPSGLNDWIGMFDDLRFEDPDSIFSNGFESGDTLAWSEAFP